MKTLREFIAEAKLKEIAIGHFNISDITALHAIAKAGRETNLPVIIGLSEGERDFVGVKQAVALVRSLREEFNQPIFINADHTYSFEKVKKAIDAGFDAVIYDGAKLPIEENIKITKQCVDYAREVSKREGRDILVEGELGYIGASSQMLEEIPAGAAITKESFTTAEEAERYVAETGVDLFSPAVGSIHGALKHSKDPDLDIERIEEIAGALSVPLVLHGGSGLTDENFTKAIKAGMAIVHINTEIRVIWRKAVEKTLAEKKDEVAPYKLLAPAEEAIREQVKARLKLFANL